MNLHSFSAWRHRSKGGSNTMRRIETPAAMLSAALLLTGCAAGGNAPKPAANLDKGAVTRVANIVQQSGEYDAAARIQASYAATHPDDRAAQLSSGETALQAGDLDKAVENFQRAAQLAPGQADAHYGLARAA